MTEIYKTMNLIHPACMWELYVEKDMPYNLHTKVLCRLSQAQENRNGLDSLSFRGSLLWNTLKDEVKRAGTLTKLEKSIVKWDGKSCNCLVCKNYFFFYLYYSLFFVFLFIVFLFFNS